MNPRKLRSARERVRRCAFELGIAVRMSEAFTYKQRRIIEHAWTQLDRMMEGNKK